MNFEIKFSYDNALGKPQLKWIVDAIEYGVEENNIAEYISDIVQKILSFQKGTNACANVEQGH